MSFPKKVTIPTKTNAIPLTDVNKQLRAEEVNAMAQTINDNALFYGLYEDLAALQAAHNAPPIGAWAFLLNGKKYECFEEGVWSPSIKEAATIENEYLSITELLAGQIDQTSAALQFVEDASADPEIEEGYAYYEKLATNTESLEDYRLLGQSEVDVILNGLQKVEDQNGNAFQAALKVVYGDGFTATQLPDGSYRLEYTSGTTPTILKKAYTESLPIMALTPPVEFNDQLELNRIWNGEKLVYVQKPYDKIDFEINGLITSTNYYVDYINGNNANDGLTTATAFKTLAYAITIAPTNSVINFMDEWIGWQNRPTTGMTLSGNYKFKSIHPSGRTWVTSMRESYTKATFNWNNEGGGMWSTSTATTTSAIFAALGRAIFDNKYKDENGGAMPVVDVGSSASCATQAGTQYHDVANSKKYVHLLDGREPDPYDGFIYSSLAYNWQIIQSADDGVILLENLDFYHNLGTAESAGCRYRHSTTAANNSIYGIKNCLAYGSSGNGFEVYDAKISVHENCHTRYTRKDGINTHSFVSGGSKGRYMTVYEQDCSAAFQGYQGFSGQNTLGNSENASTTHDGIHSERVNGYYGEGRGATVADVNGAVAVLWNCVAGPSNGGNFKSCFWHENYLSPDADGGMWLWGCKAHDGDDDTVRLLNNEAQAGGTANDGQIYVKNWRGKTDGAITGVLKDWGGNDLI